MESPRFDRCVWQDRRQKTQKQLKILVSPVPRHHPQNWQVLLHQPDNPLLSMGAWKCSSSGGVCSMCLNRTEMLSSTPRSQVQPQGLSFMLGAWQLPIPPSGLSPAPSVCSHWLPAAPSSASPAPPAQPAAFGAAPSVSAVLLCGEEGSPLAAGSQWSGWLEGRGREHHEVECWTFWVDFVKWLAVLCWLLGWGFLDIFLNQKALLSVVVTLIRLVINTNQKWSCQYWLCATGIRSGNSTALGQFQYWFVTGYRHMSHMPSCKKKTPTLQDFLLARLRD